MKLPVIKTIATTFAFTLENWATLVRIVWAPFVLMLASGFVLPLLYGDRIEAFIARGYDVTPAEVQAFMGEVMWVNYAMGIVSGLIGLMMTAGVLRFVIRGEKPKLPFYIRWGEDEWALLATVVTLFAGWILFAFMCGVLFAFTAGLLKSTLVLVIGPILMICILVWVVVRLYPAFPAAVAFGQIGIAPAWEASRGQFWRLIALLLLLALAGLVYVIALLAVFMPEILELYFAVFTGQMTALEVNEYLAQMPPPSPFHWVRGLAMWVLGLVPSVVGTVALGVAWRMIDDERTRPRVANVEGTASDIMGF